MDKKEIEVQKALGTIKKEKYRVSFIYRRKNLPGELFLYSKQVMAYTRDDATKKAMIAFVNNPKFKTGPLANHKPYKDGEGFNVTRWDNTVGKKGAWVYCPAIPSD